MESGLPSPPRRPTGNTTEGCWLPAPARPSPKRIPGIRIHLHLPVMTATCCVLVRCVRSYRPSITVHHNPFGFLFAKKVPFRRYIPLDRDCSTCLPGLAGVGDAYITARVLKCPQPFIPPPGRAHNAPTYTLTFQYLPSFIHPFPLLPALRFCFPYTCTLSTHHAMDTGMWSSRNSIAK